MTKQASCLSLLPLWSLWDVSGNGRGWKRATENRLLKIIKDTGFIYKLAQASLMSQTWATVVPAPWWQWPTWSLTVIISFKSISLSFLYISLNPEEKGLMGSGTYMEENWRNTLLRSGSNTEVNLTIILAPVYQGVPNLWATNGAPCQISGSIRLGIKGTIKT